MKKFYLFLFVPLIVGLVICHRGEFDWIAVNSEPQGAAVYLDDSLTEEVTNCVLEDVPVGEHALKLTLDGYVDWDTLVEVEAESPTTITATMILESDTTDTIPPGTLLWKSSVAGYQLLYDDETIYMQGATKKTIYALDKDGTVKWQYNTDGNYRVWLSMVDSDNDLYTTEQAYQQDPYIVSFHSNGSIEWKLTPEGAKEVKCMALNSSTKMLYWGLGVGSKYDQLMAATPDGQSQWTYTFDDLETANDLGSPLAVGSDGVVYVLVDYWDSEGMPLGYQLRAVNPEGSSKWAKDLNYTYPYGIAIASDGTLYLSGSHGLKAIDKNGADLWSSDLNITTQVITLKDGTICFGTYDGFVYNLNQDGSLKWQKYLGACYGLLAGEGGKIYCASQEYLYALDASDGTIEWQYETNGPAILSVLAEDGTLYALLPYANEWYLHAIKTESQGLANSSWPKYQADNRCSGCARW